MFLYLEQKIFSLADSFSVKDSLGADVYTVKGKVFSLGKHLDIYSNGEVIASLQQKLLSLLPRYFLEINGKQIAEIKKKLSFVKPKFIVEGLGWEVEGDFWNHEYSIGRGANLIASISKKWMSWSDTYELCITDDANVVPVLAVVLAIDCAAASKSNGNISIGA